jgi:HlyD family secretion protein
MEMIPSRIMNVTLESYLIRITSKSRVIYWIIIVLVLTVLALLPFIYVDVAIRAGGYLQSEIEKQTIYSPFQGKVIYTSIKNGKEVHKGDTLFIIDSETNKAQIIALQNKIRENNLSIADLRILSTIESSDISFESKEFRTKRYFSEFLRMKKSLDIQSQKLERVTSEHSRNEVLYKQELIPAAEFENSRYAYKTEEENLNHILVTQTSLWYADLMQRISDESSLKAEYESCYEAIKNRIVTAPVSGEIIQSIDLQIGSMISANQKVAEISPSGQLIATCYVKPDDIGLIKINQEARIQINAFNYNEWGLLDARIIDISDDILADNGSNAYFRIKCKPEKTSLSLKNGVTADLKKGMSFNARIIVTRRSLFNLLFDKAENWFNPYLNEKAI